MNWGRQAAWAAAALVICSPLVAPQLLAFPFAGKIRQHRVYSETPITPALARLVGAADVMASRSPIAQPVREQPIFLTQGGWRWALLALQNRAAFAITRAPMETIVVNRSDADRDLVFTKRAVAPQTSLARTLAHEMTHSAIRAHFGLAADWEYPAWLREGYCDYVGGGSSITDAEAHRLLTTDPHHPALPYWQGRRKVAALLTKNGGSVDALFAHYR